MSEMKVINAICHHKDIQSLFGVSEDMFVGSKDALDFLKDYYQKYSSIPDIEIVQENIDFIEKVEIAGSTDYYINQLRETYLTSKMSSIMSEASKRIKEEGSAYTLDRMLNHLSKLSATTQVTKDVDLTDVVAAQEYFEMIKKKSEANGGVPGIPTTFAGLDSAYTTGMSAGHLIVILGYTGKNKSFVSALMAVRAWEQGYSPMIISLEMSPAEYRERVYAIMGNGDFAISDLSRGEVDHEQFINWSGKKMNGVPSFIIPSLSGVHDVTPNYIQGKIDKYKPACVVVDYAQIMMDNAKSGGMNQRMTNLSHELKALAVRNEIPVIMVTAVTDDDNNKRDAPPQLSQVSWSSAIEYDANLAFAVHRHDDTDITEIAGRKNRHGPLFNFYFEADINRGIWIEREDFQI